MPKVKWTKELCLLEAQGCNGRKELQDKNEYVYNLMRKKGWLYEIFPNVIVRQNTYSNEYIEAVAAKYPTRNSFKWGDWNMYHIAQRRGIMGKICTHMKTKIGSDKDVVYLLKTMINNNQEVFKAGITSKRCKKRRLSELKCHSGSVFEVVYWVETNNAKHVEAQILKLGTQVEGLIKFGGYREMRIFTNEELAIAEDLLKQAGGV